MPSRVVLNCEVCGATIEGQRLSLRYCASCKPKGQVLNNIINELNRLVRVDPLTFAALVDIRVPTTDQIMNAFELMEGVRSFGILGVLNLALGSYGLISFDGSQFHIEHDARQRTVRSVVQELHITDRRPGFTIVDEIIRDDGSIDPVYSPDVDARSLLATLDEPTQAEQVYSAARSGVPVEGEITVGIDAARERGDAAYVVAFRTDDPDGGVVITPAPYLDGSMAAQSNGRVVRSGGRNSGRTAAFEAIIGQDSTVPDTATRRRRSVSSPPAGDRGGNNAGVLDGESGGISELDGEFPNSLEAMSRVLRRSRNRNP